METIDFNRDEGESIAVFKDDALINAVNRLVELDRMIVSTKKKLLDLYDQVTTAEESVKEVMAGRGLSRASGNDATCHLAGTIVPVVESWDAVFDYVCKTRNFHLLTKEINEDAWRDLVLKSGILVSGTLVREVQKIVLNKN